VLEQKQVGILLFNEVEVLDFAGPFEVFSITTYIGCNEKPFKVHTVAQSKELINARNGLKIKPDYDFNDAPQFDILIIPGGYGAEEIEIHNSTIINWIKDNINDVDIIASVCTGAFLLAKAGLLDGKQATTHWMDIDRLEKGYTKIDVKRLNLNGLWLNNECYCFNAGGALYVGCTTLDGYKVDETGAWVQ